MYDVVEWPSECSPPVIVRIFSKDVAMAVILGESRNKCRI